MGLTQDEVGAMIGVQKAMVSKVENGSCVNFNTISRIADALEVEPLVELKPKKKADKKCHRLYHDGDNRILKKAQSYNP